MRWISVKERYPEEGKIVIIVTDDGYVNNSIFYRILLDDNGIWSYAHRPIMYWYPALDIDGLDGVTPDLWRENCKV